MAMTNPQRTGVWDEELMCDVEMPRPVRRYGARALAGAVRAEVSARNLVRAVGCAHEVTRGSAPAVVYSTDGGRHGNFIEASYTRIMARQAWKKRLNKAHTAKRQAKPGGKDEEIRVWRELDAASSSDALLMNIFCYPRVLGKGLCSLLGVAAGSVAEFGYKPRIALQRGLVDATEIDMYLGGLLVEAKLTESGFQRAPLRLLERYPAFDRIFERDLLEIGERGVENYQLLRGVMAAAAGESKYCLMMDGRRPDLLEGWFGVVRAVRSYELQSRLRVITWQEIAGFVPGPLRKFLNEKYGIDSE